MRIPILAAVGVTAAVLAAPVSADDPQLVGTVGPGFTIHLADAAGAPVTHLDPGTYSLTVHDLADIHNFHLTGPGVNVTTDLDFVGDRTFTITLTDGTYTYVCDPHSTAMKASFTVGTVPVKQSRKAASLTLATGKTSVTAPKKLAAGAYTGTVNDRSAKENVHLVGPGVNRKTTLAFRGTVRWNLNLSSGRYRVFSDAHPKLAGAVLVP
jgi:hypothetical protein